MINMTAYDKTSEVISAIRKYDSMKNIIANTPAEIAEQYDRLASPRSVNNDGMPKTRNPQAGEERLAVGLDLINSMQQRFRTAQLFNEWFEPMWNILTDDERRLLETYKHSDERSGLIGELAADLGYTERQLFRVRKKALYKFGLLLLGE